MALGLEDVSDTKRRREGSASPSSDMSMMRIAIAGTGGLARLIAHYIDEETSHHVMFLSRQVRLHTCASSSFAVQGSAIERHSTIASRSARSGRSRLDGAVDSTPKESHLTHRDIVDVAAGTTSTYGWRIPGLRSGLH